MMLWAHNLHVIRASSAMGNDLQARYGTAYRPIAQFFGSGYVNSTGSGRLASTSVGQIKTGTFESIFSATGQPRLLLDTRTIAAGGPAAAALLGPLMMREVDELYSIAQDNAAYVPTVLPGDFDGLVWFAKSTASSLRP
jgi:erythromycin esterase-like protein